MASAAKNILSAVEFYQALVALDEEIAKSKNLRKVVPIHLLSAGGFVAVTLFENRIATEDIDYIIDPEIRDLGKIREKLNRAILSVAEQQDLNAGWINSRMELFAPGTTKQKLFRESVEQETVLWQGQNLIIYATQWEWTLARKLKRIGSENRVVDVSDAVEILNILVKQRGGPLPRDMVKAWDQIVYTPLDDEAIDRVAAVFAAKYGVPGIV